MPMERYYDAFRYLAKWGTRWLSFRAPARIEECALHGVSSIVLDPNNDLARLGDPWPAPPAGWNPGDAARAEEYLANTDVVVWTPRRPAGRPLVLRPLPAFADVLDDREEFEQVVEAAVAGLVPRVRLTAGKLDIGTAVLRQALAVYAWRRQRLDRIRRSPVGPAGWRQ